MLDNPPDWLTRSDFDALCERHGEAALARAVETVEATAWTMGLSGRPLDAGQRRDLLDEVLRDRLDIETGLEDVREGRMTGLDEVLDEMRRRGRL